MITSDYKQLSYTLVNCSQQSHDALCLLSRSAYNPFFELLLIIQFLTLKTTLTLSHHLTTRSSLNKLWFALTQGPTQQGRGRLNLSHTAVSEIHTSFISDVCFPALSHQSLTFLIRTFQQYCAFLPFFCDTFMGKNKCQLSVLNTLNETESTIYLPKRDDGHPRLFLRGGFPPPSLTRRPNRLPGVVLFYFYGSIYILGIYHLPLPLPNILP